MNKRVLAAISAAFVGLSFATPAMSASPRTGDGLRMPYQGGFWGYGGLNLGRSRYDVNCAGFSCDRDANTAKLYVGGRFNDWLGLELGWVDMGRTDFAGGHADGQGLNVSLLGGVPVGQNSSLFAKLGTTAGHTRISGTAPAASSGTENGWGLSYGIGGQFGITQNWAVRLDADRYRFKFAGNDRRDIDTLTVGLQYTFR